MPNIPPDPLALTSQEFIAAAAALGKSKHESLGAYRAYHRQGVRTSWMAEDPPATLQHTVDERTMKFLLSVGDDLETESVIIPMPHRGGRFSRTLCISSQVGCAMGCQFCETGQMGLMRSLSVREIVQQ